jgi:hypothetical protein
MSQSDDWGLGAKKAVSVLGPKHIPITSKNLRPKLYGYNTQSKQIRGKTITEIA